MIILTSHVNKNLGVAKACMFSTNGGGDPEMQEKVITKILGGVGCPGDGRHVARPGYDPICPNLSAKNN